MPQAPAQSGAKSVEGANIRSPPWLCRCQVPPLPGWDQCQALWDHGTRATWQLCSGICSCSDMALGSGHMPTAASGPVRVISPPLSLPGC